MPVLRILLSTILIATLLCSCGSANNTGKGTGSSESAAATSRQTETTEAPDPVKVKMKTMSADEKIGQLLVFGFEGTSFDGKARDMIDRFKPGGLIVMGSNVKDTPQLLELVNGIKTETSKYGIPAFISVDEEGGRVSRMPPELKDMPAALKVGRAGSGDIAYASGEVLAAELKAFGFNVDFAPVLDIWSNPKNTVIGDRAFGKDPQTVGKMGIQVMRGIASSGIIPVVKHFPGHGDTTADSHKELPLSGSTLERLESFELKPFEEAIANGADVVMVAHILVEKLDDKFPASLSRAVITDLLRNRMGFGGVVITDDMTMGAISKNYGIAEAAVASFLAGSDLILVVGGYENETLVYEALKSALADGRISEERLDESVYRILKLKDKYGIAKTAGKQIDSVDIGDLNNKINSFNKSLTNK